MVYDAGRGVLLHFGGGASSGCDTCSRHGAETWTWDGHRWLLLHPSVSPTPRAEPGLAYDAKHQLVVLFGGQDQNGNALDDTWTWDGASWKQLRPSVSPGPRGRARMAFDSKRDEVILYGGFGTGPGDIPYDTWTWDGTTWSKVSVAQTPGAPADTHLGGSMAFDEATSTAVLYGGCVNAPPSPPTYTFDGRTWSSHPVHGPPGTCGPAMAYDGGSHDIVLFGGNSGSSAQAETWVWDGASWTQKAPATSPPARTFAFMAYDAGRREVVLFGGFVTSQAGVTSTASDTWAWNGAAWTRLA